MTITQELLDGLTQKAALSERRRMNLDMRNSADDMSQRMLNALEPDTVLPIHRHRHSSETVIIVRGAIEQLFFDNEGHVTERFTLRPGADIVGLNVPAGQWHRTVALEHGTVIFEAKDGAYQPLSEDDILTL